jgi:hypothetical protein
MATAYGDVIPALPTGGLAAPAAMDFDGSGALDLLFTGGNGIVSSGLGADPASPRWDGSDVWRAWDNNQDAIVGETALGRLALSGGEVMRWRHLMIGKEAGATGYVTLSGDGTRFTNSRENVPWADKLATRLATGSYGSDRDAFFTTVKAIDYDDIGAYTTGASFTRVRRAKGSWNVWAGMAGYGGLSIEAGAQMEVEHQLLVGGQVISEAWEDGAGGYVQISGSELIVYGVAYASSSADPSTGAASRIGARGLIDVRGSILRFAQGLENTGTIVVRAGGGGRPTVLRGDLTNSGVIYVEEGATLLYEGDYTEAGGVVYRAKCGDPAVIIGLPSVDEVDGERVKVA